MAAKVCNEKGMRRFPDIIVIILIIVKNCYTNGRIRNRYDDPDLDRFVDGCRLGTVLENRTYYGHDHIISCGENLP